MICSNLLSARTLLFSSNPSEALVNWPMKTHTRIETENITTHITLRSKHTFGMMTTYLFKLESLTLFWWLMITQKTETHFIWKLKLTLHMKTETTLHLKTETKLHLKTETHTSPENWNSHSIWKLKTYTPSENWNSHSIWKRKLITPLPMMIQSKLTFFSREKYTIKLASIILKDSYL